ncbi:MAG: hypothetical protein JWP01_3694 [Myxococcales bacterium]|nr:hypothetical protein [Myxococcales bacterium]
MSRLASWSLSLALPCALAACTTTEAADESGDLIAAAEEALLSISGKADAAWDTAPTLHVGERVHDRASAQGRRVYPMWIAGRPGAPVPLDVVATAHDGDYSVRVAVLGPLRNGTRAVLAAGGYATPRANVEISLDVKTAGEHLIVVGSHDLADETFFDVQTHCDACDARAIDVLSSPKSGSLVATGNGIVEGRLGDVLANRTFDVQLELWASPPMQSWNAHKVATSVASGNQVNVIVPASVRPGDDLKLVVRKPGGAILDTGVVTRYAPQATALVRTDAILYGDIASVQVAGIAGFYEGVAEMQLRSETRHVIVDEDHIEISQPGHVGMGFNAFDATFAPELTDAHGTLNPNLPRNGDLLSVGMINGNDDYVRLGCFQYCNDLSGMETCTGGPRTCPSTAW